MVNCCSLESSSVYLHFELEFCARCAYMEAARATIVDTNENTTESILRYPCAMLDLILVRTRGIVGAHLLIFRPSLACDQSRDKDYVAQRRDGRNDRERSGHHQECRWVAHQVERCQVEVSAAAARETVAIIFRAVFSQIVDNGLLENDC